MQIRLSLTSLQTGGVLAVCAWALSPPLAYSSIARLLCLLGVAVWFTIEMAKPRGIVRSPTLPMLLWMVYCIYTLTFEIMVHGASGIISRLQLYIMLFFLPVYLANRKNPDTLFFLFWIVVLLNVVWMTSTYLFLSTVDARAMRSLVRSTEETRDIVEQGVGGIAMAYNAAMLMPALLAMSLRPGLIARFNPPKLLRIVRFVPVLTIWYLTALCGLLVVSSQFSIAVLLMLISTISVVVLWRVTTARVFLAVFLSVLVLGFGEPLMIAVLHMLEPYADGTNYALKIRDLIASLEQNTAAGTAGDRVERYTRSIALFLENPVFGTLSYDDVGKHSTILDHFARWGLGIGAIFLHLIAVLPARAMWRGRYIPGGFGVAFGALVAVLMVMGLNKGVGATGIIVFLVYPIVFGVLAQANPEADRAPRGMSGVAHA